MKKVLVIVLTVVLALSFAACGGAVESSDEFEPVTLRLANQHAMDNEATVAAELAAANIYERTEGRVSVEVYPNSSLGDYEQVYDDVMNGVIDMAHITIPDTYDASITAAMMPYLVSSYDQLETAFGVDSYLSQHVAAIQQEYGVTFLGYFVEGFAGVATTKPVTDPAGVGTDKKVLVRVPGNDCFRLPTEYLGYETATISWADTFTAIQTGVVDGWQAGQPSVQWLNMRDIVDYFYHYMMDVEATQIVINSSVLEGLLEEDQAVVREEFADMCSVQMGDLEAQEAAYLEMLDDYGIEIIYFTDEELTAIADGVRANVWPELATVYGEDFVDGLIEGLGY